MRRSRLMFRSLIAASTWMAVRSPPSPLPLAHPQVVAVSSICSCAISPPSPDPRSADTRKGVPAAVLDPSAPRAFQRRRSVARLALAGTPGESSTMDPNPLEQLANEGFLRHFSGRGHAGRPAVERPDEVEQPYMTLGTHPD